MGTTIKQSKEQVDLKRAADLMRSYAELAREKASIAEQFGEAMGPITASMKEAEAELIEIGKRNRKAFDKSKNLVFDEGYIHIADVTSVKLGNAFSLGKFLRKFSEFVDVSFKIAPLKKAWLDGDQRNAIAKHDLDLQVDDQYQIKVIKKDADQKKTA